MRFRAVALFALLAVIGGCTPTDPSQPSDPRQETFAASLEVDIPSMVELHPGDLYYKDLVLGGGPVVSEGKTITVTYSGYLKDGTLFDTNLNSDSLRVPLVGGDNGVITGWVLGLPGMKAGGVRKLVISSSYGYGSRSIGAIPPHSTLVFDVYVKRVE